MSNSSVISNGESQLYNHDTECPICLEQIGHTNTITTVCGHRFHASCIIQNLYLSDSCPICRRVIDENKLDDPHGLDGPESPDGIDGLTDNDIESFIETLTHETGSSTRMAREIIDLIQNSHIPGNVQPVEQVGQVEQIEDIIRNNMTYFGFDFVDILRNAGEWSDGDGDGDMAREGEGERGERRERNENTREDFAHGMAVET